jgi:Fe2+ or Zn2+ uptake regulation protein
MTRDDDLVTALHERGQRVTVQRLLILRALRELDRHATAEDVLKAVDDRLPNVSLPTIYSTLELFEELGLARRVDTGSGPVLYDPQLRGHSHVVCRHCGRVEDIAIEPETEAALTAARRAGFEPRSAELVVSGLCRACHQ